MFSFSTCITSDDSQTWVLIFSISQQLRAPDFNLSKLYPLIFIKPFHMSIDHLYIFIGKTSVRLLYPFLIRLDFSTMSCESSLYILGINPLSDILLANVFSRSVGSFFILLKMCLTCKSVLVWCGPTCLCLLLFPLLEETCPKKGFLRWMSKGKMSMFSSRSFISPGLIYIYL